MSATVAVSSADGRLRRVVAGALGLLVAMAIALPAAEAPVAARGANQLVRVIVRALPGSAPGAARLVEELGGRVGQRLDIIDGFAASVPDRGLAALRRLPGVRSITPDGTVRLAGALPTANLGGVLGLAGGLFGDSAARGSMYDTTKAIGAHGLWNKKITGKGVDVALIDSGVVGVNGLRKPGKVINGPDLSFESQDADLAYLDTNGHGTHMAGIIAGRDDELTNLPGDATRFAGVAPDARILSLKVATATGATDVSQMLAAIDWVVAHRRDNGMNIRVLNLSFGTDSSQPYLLDPLAYAAEVAWRKGIVVVVAAGNQGTTLGRLTNPAIDPFVIATGAADLNNPGSTLDDKVADFSSRGNGTRNPDLIAPGRSVASLRNPGSHNDVNYPSAVTNDRFFRGSGSSQAAAITSGAAALLIQQRPTITPDQVKALLQASARKLLLTDARAQGAGLLDLANADRTATPTSVQRWARSTGTGLLEQARGTYHVIDDSFELRGEQDIFGKPFTSATWASNSLAGTSWSGGTWNNSAWTGSAWSATSWSGTSWSGRMWSGRMWSGRMWSDSSWSRNSWSGRMWSGRMWG
jgi:serine protease AprX